ncbi:three-Cys-motif partner protein TcmP [Foetidibacter luteolus]|uniref:three-Cys-motif partner protein TcmP n=1 Tax=Foetidibacter luteolus TaxID=2608880 RepID=UPI00129A553C|nr:three-Cys-motif partner protein TcmP [Foetidibacter luteolus]
MNQQFGGDWTQQKIEIVVSYARAYLTIMNKYPQFRTLYFDGFAGSGSISKEESEIDTVKGTAIRILEIDSPKTFDMYYFVEKNGAYKKDLEATIKSDFSIRNAFVVNEDCNKKLIDLAKFLKKERDFRVLAFIDPYGMVVKWSSIQALSGLGVDLWILVPTGIGVGRLLKNDGNISDGWYSKLEDFLGIKRGEIKERFYKEVSMQDLFGADITLHYKESNSIQKIHALYKERLSTVFRFVSDAFVLRNSQNSIMYHFVMATNNEAALKIANHIVKPKYKL